MQLIPVLFGITFLSFAMMRAAGSDAVMELYGDKGAVAQEIIDARRAELGLDQSFFTQYLAWLRGILTGDMGISYVSGKNVFDIFVSKLPATLLLTALSMGATVVLSIPLGVLAAVRHDKFTDYFLRFFSFTGNSMPNFFVALLLMQIFSIHWKLLPVISGGNTVQSALLPTLTLAIAMSAKFDRALINFINSGQHVEYGRFSCSVRSDNTDDFTLVNLEAYIFHRNNAAESFRYSIDL